MLRAPSSLAAPERRTVAMRTVTRERLRSARLARAVSRTVNRPLPAELREALARPIVTALRPVVIRRRRAVRASSVSRPEIPHARAQRKVTRTPLARSVRSLSRAGTVTFPSGAAAACGAAGSGCG
jgi:hypothetical protein